MNAAALGIGAALMWGVHDFSARFASEAIGARMATAGVTTAGAILLTLLVAVLGRPHVAMQSALLLPALSGVLLLSATICMFSALLRGPFAIVAPIASAYPVFVVAWSWFGGAAPGGVEALAIVAVVGGVATVTRYAGEATGANEHRLAAIVLALGAGLSFAGAVVAGQAAAVHYGEVEAAWLGRLAGVAALPLLLMLPTDGSLPPTRVPARWWAVLFGMGAVDAGAMLALVSAGVLENPQHAAVTSSGFGAVTVVLATLVLRERVRAVQWLGIAAVVLGSATLAAR